MAFNPDEYLKEPFNPDAYLENSAPLGERLSTGLAQSFAGVGNAVDAAGSMLAGAAVSPFSSDTAESIYSSMNEREKSRNQWANPKNIDVGMGGKIAGAVGTLPMQIATFPLSAFTTGKTAADAGESKAKALGAVGLDVAGNIVASLIGPGKSIYTSIAKQAGANAAQDYVTKWVTQQLMDTKQGKEAFDPKLVDSIVAGIVGGGMGAVTHQAPASKSPSPKVAGIEADLEAAKTAPKVDDAPIKEQGKPLEVRFAEYQRQKKLAEESAFNQTPKVDDAPIKEQGKPLEVRFAEYQRQKKLAEESAFNQTPEVDKRIPNTNQMEIDDTQHVLPDTNQVIAPQYGAMAGEGRFDENGMPIKADLTMEAQNVESPLQRNLWGDELAQKHEQENPSSLTQAIDSMPPGPARDIALERLRTTPVEAPELGMAVATTNTVADRGGDFGDPSMTVTAPLGSKARAAQVAAKKPQGLKSQRGKVHEDLLGIGKAAEWIKSTLARVSDAPVKKIMEKFKGTFNESMLAIAYNKTIDPKGRQHTVLMSPKDFHDLAQARGSDAMTSSEAGKKRASVREGLDTDAGLDSLPYLIVDKNGKVTGHEGRHRMDVLSSKGVDVIPVEIMHDWTTNDKFPHRELQPQDSPVNVGYKAPVAIGDNLASFGKNERKVTSGKFSEGEIPKSVVEAYLRLKEATRRPNAYENPHGTTAYRQALTKAQNAFDKAVEVSGLNHNTVFNSLSELHGKPSTELVPFNSTKMSGGLFFGEKAKDAVETIKKGPIGEMLPELQTVAKTPSGVIAAMNGLKDVSNNLLQKSSRLFTKGFLYEKFKTNHPLIKYTYDRLSDAIDAGTKANHKILQEDLLPKLRALKDVELTELHGAMLASMKAKSALSAEMLRKNGFNEKQIATWESFQAAYKNSLGEINKVRQDAGLPDLDPYIGYMAGHATGAFRTLITKKDSKGNPQTVGIVGANTKYGMDYRIKKILAEHPEYSQGEYKYYGDVGRGKNGNSLAEALTLLSDKDPNVLAFIDEYSKMMQDEAYDFHGAKRHTMEKKGVFGMEGDKPWKDPYKNALEGFEAQVRYIETMSKWAELSKATKDLKEVFSDPSVQQAHPNAVAMSKEYLSNALGFNNSRVGNSITNVIAAVGESTGLGTQYFNTAVQGVRGGINTIFFALKPIFLIANHLQAYLKTPTMVNYLRDRGLDVGTLTTTGHTEFMKAGLEGLNYLWGKETPFSRAMWEYGKDHGISATQIFEHSTDIRKGLSHYKNAVLEAGMGAAEGVPRSMMYVMMSNILRKNGFEGHPDIFKMARELTNVAMADYRPHEAQRANKMTGPLAPLLGNLSTYAANENSTLALLARDSVKTKRPSAMLAAILTGLAAHGLMGFPGFSEADYLYEKLSGWIGGKPRTLTDTILTQAGPKGKLGDAVSLGMPAAAGIDMHNILGRSSILPAILGGGGAGAAWDIGVQAKETIKDPSEMNLKRLGYLTNPVGVAKGPLELEWFSRETKKGNLALDRRVGHGGEGTYMRNEFDKQARMAGVTSTREYKLKEQLRQQRTEDFHYAEKQKTIIARYFDKREKASYSKDDLTKSLDQYIENRGDPNTFIAEMVKHGVNMNTSAVTRYLIQKASSGKPSDILALKRFKERTYTETEAQ